MTVSRHLCFGTTERLATRHSDVVGKALVRVLTFDMQRSFQVKECHGDSEFEPICGDLADANAHLNTTSEDEHVPTVERDIRTLKDLARAAYNTVPFKKMPGVMIVKLVHGSNYWLNMFPARDGVLSTQSPQRIMTGQHCDYHLHGQVQFGKYVQVHKFHDNTMATCTTGAIALRRTGNTQGGYFFMSLSSGKRLKRKSWTALPMPREVIDRVHSLSHRNPAGGALVSGWQDGTEVEDELSDVDDLHNEDYVPNDDSELDNDSDSYHDNDDSDWGNYHATGVGTGHYSDTDSGKDYDEDSDKDYDNDHDSACITKTDDDANSHANSETGSNDNKSIGSDMTNTPKDILGPPVALDLVENAGVEEAPIGNVGVEEIPVRNPGVEANEEPTGNTGVDADMCLKCGPRARDGMRPWRQPRLPTKIKVPQSSAHHALNSIIGYELAGLPTFPSIAPHFMLTQYNLKRGIAIFGEAASAAVVKVMKQLHDSKTIRPRYLSELSLVKKRKALAYLMFIKEKRCGTIKGHGCADGRKQRLYKTREETSSPMVQTESLLLMQKSDER